MKWFFVFVILLSLSSCRCYRILYEENSLNGSQMIGRYSNKLYKEKPTYSAEDPNILKTNYKECLQDIILKNLPNNFDYKQIKDKQNIYVHLYFDSSNLLPKEIYMSAMNFDIFSVFSQNDIKHIEDDIKKELKLQKI